MRFAYSRADESAIEPALSEVERVSRVCVVIVSLQIEGMKNETRPKQICHY